MHIISIKMLREFWQKHPESEKVLREWHLIVEHTDFKSFNHIRETFNSAEYVPPYTVFDIGGNNYRVVVIVRYRFKKVFVHKVLTHRQYDDWNKLYQKGEV